MNSDLTTEAIFKNILWQPQEAFKTETLRKTLPGSVVAFFVLGLIASIFDTTAKLQRSSFAARHPWLLHFPHIVPFGFFVFMFLGICLQARIVRLLVRHDEQEIDLRALISGATWIYALTIPIGWALAIVLHGLTKWIIVPYRIWLTAICIQSLAGISMRASSWLLIRAFFWIVMGGMLFGLGLYELLSLGRFLS